MSSIHSTVLTDIDGFRHYAVILTFYREFYATKVRKRFFVNHLIPRQIIHLLS